MAFPEACGEFARSDPELGSRLCRQQRASALDDSWIEHTPRPPSFAVRQPLVDGFDCDMKSKTSVLSCSNQRVSTAPASAARALRMLAMSALVSMLEAAKRWS